MEFASRSSNIFNKLNVIEKEHKTWMSKNETFESFDPYNHEPCVGSSVEFKVPFKPISRKRKSNFLPAQKSKKKWIKYSLEDIPLSSDALNSAIAFSFLAELRKEREKVTSSDDKVIFRKPFKSSHKGPLNATNQVSSTSVCNNEVMELQSQTVEFSANKVKKLSSDIKLSHLEEYFDDA